MLRGREDFCVREGVWWRCGKSFFSKGGKGAQEEARSRAAQISAVSRQGGELCRGHGGDGAGRLRGRIRGSACARDVCGAVLRGAEYAHRRARISAFGHRVFSHAFHPALYGRPRCGVCGRLHNILSDAQEREHSLDHRDRASFRASARGAHGGVRRSGDRGGALFRAGGRIRVLRTNDMLCCAFQGYKDQIHAR